MSLSVRFKRQVISCISRLIRRHVKDEPLLQLLSVVATECQRTCHNYMLLTLWCSDKWLAICRGHIQVHFRAWNRFYLDWNFTGIPNCPINRLPAFVQIITWWQSAHKPLSETIIVYYIDAYVVHSALLGWWGFIDVVITLQSGLVRHQYLALTHWALFRNVSNVTITHDQRFVSSNNWRLFDTKPLPESTLMCCQLEH